MATSKVVYSGKTLIDLTEDTITEETLLRGYTAHKADGTKIVGTAFKTTLRDIRFSIPFRIQRGRISLIKRIM